MNYFWQVFKFYNKPSYGLFYMPARWLIVPFPQIEQYLPKGGLIIDVGCGEGILSVFLAISSPKRKVYGLDINKKKIYLAKSVSKKIPNLSFEIKNVLTTNLPKADGFILSDFLHHTPRLNHQSLLKKIASATKPKGVIIIKEINLEDKIRSKISRLFDFLFYPNEDINFIYGNNLMNSLTRLGLKVNIVKVKKWFPGSTTLFICQKY